MYRIYLRAVIFIKIVIIISKKHYQKMNENVKLKPQNIFTSEILSETCRNRFDTS